MTATQLLAQNHSESFDINGYFLIAQILNLIILVSYIWLVCKAIARVAKMGNGVEVPIWIFAIVLLPIFGAVATLLHYQKPGQEL